MKFKLTILLVCLLVIFALAMPALAAPVDVRNASPAGSALFELTPEEAASLLLGFVGVVLSAVFKYVPKWKDWYESFEHQGLLMLGFVVIAGGIYFALSCTPYADILGVQIACELASAFLLLKAIVFIAVGNQLAYLYLPDPESKPKSFG